MRIASRAAASNLETRRARANQCVRSSGLVRQVKENLQRGQRPAAQGGLNRRFSRSPSGARTRRDLDRGGAVAARLLAPVQTLIRRTQERFDLEREVRPVQLGRGARRSSPSPAHRRSRVMNGAPLTMARIFSATNSAPSIAGLRQHDQELLAPRGAPASRWWNGSTSACGPRTAAAHRRRRRGRLTSFTCLKWSTSHMITDSGVP